MYGLLDEKRVELESLCRRFGVCRLEVFGSVVSGGFKPETSDYDFLVTFDPCSPEEHANRYFGLLAALEDLLGASVDLVEPGAITNPYFLTSVNASRDTVYAA